MKANRILIAEDLELPFKCDLYVLEKIQEKYETIPTFEKLIVSSEPSISAINFALPLMIREGMEIEHIADDPQFKNDEDIIRAVSVSYRKIAIDMHMEFAKCFQIKKKPSRKMNMKT